MLIHLGQEDLVNRQQIEVAVNGPDGATHLILCAGIAQLRPVAQDAYTFLIGPQLSRRGFVGAIASGAISTIHIENKNRLDSAAELDTGLISICALFDDEAGQVKVTVEIATSILITKLAVGYNVNILAELPIH